MAGTRYAAFLRGISPMNATMAGLRRAFEAAGFDDVSTVISSGNVVFGARILAATPTEVYTAYVMGPRGGEFMRVLEEAYGQEITTRSWDTVKKVVNRGAQAAPSRAAPRRRTS